MVLLQGGLAGPQLETGTRNSDAAANATASHFLELVFMREGDPARPGQVKLYREAAAICKSRRLLAG
ncbi:MAG: hypothetical protein DI536_15865 [Archangium gephyra]|uniref:Uncharacterized protein n=1 Tax=Archangium gephyra TaxID=48 RepID=A0A2W5TF11_9BACT|nr:MAG: hypothetical protein DI536_15865 [Archangium gephyra]